MYDKLAPRVEDLESAFRIRQVEVAAHDDRRFGLMLAGGKKVWVVLHDRPSLTKELQGIKEQREMMKGYNNTHDQEQKEAKKKVSLYRRQNRSFLC